MPRLGHKKSRNGCLACKARHVKCDEQRPCSSCARHGVECSLVTWDPDAPPPPPIKREGASPSKVTKTVVERPRKQSTSTHSTSASLPIDYVLNPSPAATSDSGSPYSQDDTYPFLTKFVNKDDNVQSNYWARDLELMHHWTTEAYLTVSMREDLQHMWRIPGPKQAIRHHFLIHELLAFSALHLAYLDPDQRKAFYALGMHHQDLAIRALRKTLPNLSADNAGALFATSALITLSVLGSTGLDAKDPTTKSRPLLEDLLDIFALQQGMSTILSSSAGYVLESPFSPMLKDCPIEVPAQPMLAQLHEKLPQLTAYIDMRADLSPEVRREALDNITPLKEVLEFAMAPFSDNRELRFLFFWPIRMTPAFFHMLRQKETPALVILAFYSVAFRAAEPIYWFMDGWAERILRTIAETIEPSWHPIIQWPWEVIIGTPHGPELQLEGRNFNIKAEGTHDWHPQ